jgi:hypothetical protein
VPPAEKILVRPASGTDVPHVLDAVGYEITALQMRLPLAGP